MSINVASTLSSLRRRVPSPAAVFESDPNTRVLKVLDCDDCRVNATTNSIGRILQVIKTLQAVQTLQQAQVLRIVPQPSPGIRPLVGRGSELANSQALQPIVDTLFWVVDDILIEVLGVTDLPNRVIETRSIPIPLNHAVQSRRSRRDCPEQKALGQVTTGRVLKEKVRSRFQSRTGDRTLDA